MSHFFGFILAIVLLQSCMFLLKMDSSFYFDEVAFLIVIGGTFCAAVITYPISHLLKMGQAFFRIARKNPESYSASVAQLIQLAVIAQTSRASLLEASKDTKYNPYLRDGIELILSGFTTEEIEEIMSERLFRDREREEVYGAILRTLSKYPPAFGLVGTVLGLVSVMRAVSGGADSSEIGLEMALALVATFYGLILANFVLVPMSENLFNKSAVNMAHREILLQGMLMIKENKSPIYIQEKLNSFLPPLKRKDLVGLNEHREAA